MTPRIQLLLAALMLAVPMMAVNDDGQKTAKDPFLEELPVVEAAALHAQKLDDAPADVTVISRGEIRDYGYRTLGEALASVRGFYTSSDHIYTYTGVSGFSLPGDFNTRFLVMINGHTMTENIYSSNGFFGQDFGLDMDLVERIEVVRGPSSALYGSNGIFATINIVTVSPVDSPGFYASTETGSFGEKKAMVSGSYYLGKGANLLISASVVNNTGENFDFPELGGNAIGMDGERAYHTFAVLVWHDWTITSMFSDRDKQAPLAWDYNANNFTRGNHAIDGRGYVSAVYNREAGPGHLRWELSFDKYHYKDRFDYVESDGLLDHRSYAFGDWLTSRLVYQVPAGRFGDLTAGLEGSFDLKNLQYDLEVSPQQLQLLNINRPGRSAGIFLQDEKRLSSRWKLDLGVRFDEHNYYGGVVSPRIAIAYEFSAKTVYKFIFGRPYRNPSANEQFYYDGAGFLKPPPLKPEVANTFEFVAEHHFRHNLTGTVHLYSYQMTNLIQAIYSDNGASTFENVAGALSRGVEWEFGGKPRPWIEANASFSWQKANPSGSSIRFTNSPAFLSKARWAIPGKRITFANEFQWMSSRLDYNGDGVRPVLLADLTLTVHRMLPGADLQFGVRNAFNWSYSDPVGLSADTFPGEGRTMYVKAIWRSSR